MVITGKVGPGDEKFDFPATLVEHSDDATNGFIEKLWAVRRVGEIIDEIDLKGKNDELVKELVQLATRHGILTPYTSFLSDEQTDRHNFAANATRTGEQLQRQLSVVDGRGGFAQRAAKGSFQRADRAEESRRGSLGGAYYEADAAAASPATARAPAPGGAKGFGGGRPQGGPSRMGLNGALAGGSGGGGAVEAAQLEQAEAAVQRVGRKTFYRQGQRWVDADVTPAQEKDPVKIERFSSEYFELIDKYGKDVAKYLNFDEPVVVEIGGKAYAF